MGSTEERTVKLLTAAALTTVAVSLASTCAVLYITAKEAHQPVGKAQAAEEEEEDEEDVILAEWLGQGGDDRLFVNPKTGMNKYNAPIRSPENAIFRSSCTANVATTFAFEQGKRMVRALMAAKKAKTEMHWRDAYQSLAMRIRMRLCSVWGYRPDSSALTLCPSGTDAEYIPLLLALGRALTMEQSAENKGKGGVFTVIAAGGEVGSGTVQAAMGCHFTTSAPNKAVVSCGESLFDLPKAGLRPTASAQVLLRNQDTGRLKPTGETDAEVERIVETALGVHGYSVCVVHMVVGTKTGHQLPSIGCVNRLTRQYGSRVLPVVDACQGRLQEGSVQDFLDNEMCVLCTGSKFYGGPPFSGAALMSNNQAGELEQIITDCPAFKELLEASQLHTYFDPVLIADRMPLLKECIQTKCAAFGTPSVGAVCLRWTLALHEIERYHAIPQLQLDAIIREWVSECRNLVTELRSDLVKLLYDQAEAVENTRATSDDGRLPHKDDFGPEVDARYHPGQGDEIINTIVSLKLRRPITGGQTVPLTLEEYKHLHLLMALDLKKYKREVCYKSRLPSAHVQQLLQTRCFIAQPVTIAKTRHIIRVAMSAPCAWECYDQERFFLDNVHGKLHPGVNRALEQDRVVFEKMLLVLENWSVFEKAGGK